MSTVMYAYRCKIEDMWRVVSAFRKIAKAQTFDREYIRKMYFKNPTLWKSEIEVDLQFFMRGQNYIFRILAQGYVYQNRASTIPFIQPVIYDNRTDVPPEQEKNEKIARWMDGMIAARQYILVPIISIEDIIYG